MIYEIMFTKTKVKILLTAANPSDLAKRVKLSYGDYEYKIIKNYIGE